MLIRFNRGCWGVLRPKHLGKLLLSIDFKKKAVSANLQAKLTSPVRENNRNATPALAHVKSTPPFTLYGADLTTAYCTDETLLMGLIFLKGVLVFFFETFHVLRKKFTGNNYRFE